MSKRSTDHVIISESGDDPLTQALLTYHTNSLLFGLALLRKYEKHTMVLQLLAADFYGFIFRVIKLNDVEVRLYFSQGLVKYLEAILDFKI